MKVLRYKNNFHIFLPSYVVDEMHLKEGEEVDFVEIAKGRFAIVKRNELGGIVKKAFGIEKEMEKEELDFLEYIKKYFKEEERTPYNLRKNLTKEQLNILNKMISKGIIRVRRDEDGNIRYKIVEKPEESKKELNWDYMIVDSLTAEKISKEYGNEIKNGEIIGVRGFDKMFYIVKSSYYDIIYEKIKKALQNGVKSVEEIAEAIGLNNEACRVVIQVMLSKGEIIEKRKGLFSLS